MFLICCSKNPFMKHMYSSFTPNLSRDHHVIMSFDCIHGMQLDARPIFNYTYLARLAKFWTTFATKVSFLAVFSSGYSATGHGESNLCSLALPFSFCFTLTQLEKAGRQDCRAKESQENGSADELKASILSFHAKSLSDAVQSRPQITNVQEQRSTTRGLGRASPFIWFSIVKFSVWFASSPVYCLPGELGP